MTTAGRVLRFSPPIAGSKATHHTSPRGGGGQLFAAAMSYVADQALDPFRCFAFVRLVGGHGAIGSLEVASGHVWACEVVQEAADASAPDDAVQAGVDLVVDGDCQFFRHRPALQYGVNTYCSRRVNAISQLMALTSGLIFRRHRAARPLQ